MSIAEIKQQLHNYIEAATEKDIQAIFSFLEDNSSVRYSYSEAELNEFYSRREKFLKGESKGHTVKDVHSYIRQRKNGA